MDSFTLVDGGSAAILLISAILAYSRGLVREVLSIAGWVAAAVSAFIFAPSVEPLVREIPIISDIVGARCELSIIAAFAAVFALTLAIVAIFTPLFSGIIQRSVLSSFDQSLGFLFGAMRGLILILVKSGILFDLKRTELVDFVSILSRFPFVILLRMSLNSKLIKCTL